MTVKLDGTKAELLNEEPMIIKNLKNWYHIHSYGGWSKFFQGLKQGKLFGTRCTNPDCQEHRVFIPPRPDCVDCWHRTEWVEVPAGRHHLHVLRRSPTRASCSAPRRRSR